jgi:hypothetical protein
MEIHLFKEDWFPKYIRQTLDGLHDDTSPDAEAIATSIMVAGAFIAQAIDCSVGPHSEEHEGSLSSELHNLASTMYDIHREGND